MSPRSVCAPLARGRHSVGHGKEGYVRLRAGTIKFEDLVESHTLFVFGMQETSTADPLHHVHVTFKLSRNESLLGRSTSVYPAPTEHVEFSTNRFVSHFWLLHDSMPEGVSFRVFADDSERSSVYCECVSRGARRSFSRMLSRHLMPITMLYGKQMFKCWWDAVTCHRMLWKQEVYHRDITPSNLMYERDNAGGVVGVLTDFGNAKASDFEPVVQHSDSEPEEQPGSQDTSESESV